MHLFCAIVYKVYDHHDVERKSPPERFVVEKVGSCSTLVAEEIFRTRPEVKDLSFLHLVRAAIVVDTVNLDPARMKTTPKDVSILERVEGLLRTEGPLPETREVLLRRLSHAKGDVSSFSTDMLIRKDVKVGQKCRSGVEER